ncbi:MAG: iron chaperone [Acidobacteriota bacterium]
MVKVSKSDFTVAGYFACTPAPARKLLRQMRETIRSAVPRDAVEVISYRMPAFKHGRVLVWYAAFADHVSLFPGGSVPAGFQGDLADFKTSKGTIQFPLDRSLPTALVRRIVRARVAEIQRKGPR